MKATKSKASKNGRHSRGLVADLPALPCLLTQQMGIEGWATLEPVLLAALASADPLLLIGQPAT